MAELARTGPPGTARQPRRRLERAASEPCSPARGQIPCSRRKTIHCRFHSRLGVAWVRVELLELRIKAPRSSRRHVQIGSLDPTRYPRFVGLAGRRAAAVNTAEERRRKGSKVTTTLLRGQRGAFPAPVAMRMPDRAAAPASPASGRHMAATAIVEQSRRDRHFGHLRQCWFAGRLTYCRPAGRPYCVGRHRSSIHGVFFRDPLDPSGAPSLTQVP